MLTKQNGITNLKLIFAHYVPLCLGKIYREKNSADRGEVLPVGLEPTTLRV